MKETLIPIDQLNQLGDLEDIDLSDGFVCDVETGICGPVEKAEKEKTEEEKKECK